MSLTIHTFYETVTFQDWIAVLAAALGCGLLMGLERERHQSKEHKQATAAP
ncbi:MgtC/SapB family protein [Acinetobacter brisouii]|uniref:MgtC/SapB family protein n=1 Tax=Acinetobacter brisouii TaxID=396323 RepID=UPI001D188089